MLGIADFWVGHFSRFFFVFYVCYDENNYPWMDILFEVLGGNKSPIISNDIITPLQKLSIQYFWGGFWSWFFRAIVHTKHTVNIPSTLKFSSLSPYFLRWEGTGPLLSYYPFFFFF